MSFFTNTTSSRREDYLQCLNEYSCSIPDGGCCTIWESTFGNIWSAAKRRTASVGVMFTSSGSSDYDDDENSIIFDESESEEEVEDKMVTKYPETTTISDRRALPSTRSAEELEVLWLSSESYEEDDMEVIEFTDSKKDRSSKNRHHTDNNNNLSTLFEESEYCKEKLTLDTTNGSSWFGSFGDGDLSFTCAIVGICYGNGIYTSR